MADFDLIVIGAGIVGLATARQLQKKAPQLRIAVLEKEPIPAKHQSGHNSGVIHSGIYYKPGSAKAKNCLAGIKQLTDYCDKKGIPYSRSGKVIVATEEEELPRLEELERRGLANGVKGLQMIGPERLRELEPAAAGIQALYSPYTAVIDFKEVAANLKEDIIAAGGEVFFNQQVLALHHAQEEVFVYSQDKEYKTRQMINCAGLHADRILKLSTGKKNSHRILPFRGEYYKLSPQAKKLVHGLIYPVPDPSFPFLGVHFTKMINGEVEAGPNAVFAWAREGYRKTSFNAKDCLDCMTYRGTWAMARRYWKMGLVEMWRSFSKAAFLHSLQRLVPDIRSDDIVAGGAGVRAQVINPDGTMYDDFLIEKTPRCIHVLNAPSPAATASLAIGNHLANVALKEIP